MYAYPEVSHIEHGRFISKELRYKTTVFQWLKLLEPFLSKAEKLVSQWLCIVSKPRIQLWPIVAPFLFESHRHSCIHSKLTRTCQPSYQKSYQPFGFAGCSIYWAANLCGGKTLLLSCCLSCKWNQPIHSFTAPLAHAWPIVWLKQSAPEPIAARIISSFWSNSRQILSPICFPTNRRFHNTQSNGRGEK